MSFFTSVNESGSPFNLQNRSVTLIFLFLRKSIVNFDSRMLEYLHWLLVNVDHVTFTRIHCLTHKLKLNPKIKIVEHTLYVIYAFNRNNYSLEILFFRFYFKMKSVLKLLNLILYAYLFPIDNKSKDVKIVSIQSKLCVTFIAFILRLYKNESFWIFWTLIRVHITEKIFS